MSEKVFDSNEYMLKMLGDDKPHIKIIALFALAKKIKFNNLEQVQRFIKRNAKPAKELDCYDMNRIRDVILFLIEEYDGKYKIGLETVIKYINEDISKLSKKKPIIILKDGEKVYDTDRLAKLERAKRINYSGSVWLEN
jgi:hypothetical protein